MRFHIYRGATRDWYWRLVAANGKIIATGEGYRRKRGAMDAIDLMRKAVNAPVEFLQPDHAAV